MAEEVCKYWFVNHGTINIIQSGELQRLTDLVREWCGEQDIGGIPCNKRNPSYLSVCSFDFAVKERRCGGEQRLNDLALPKRVSCYVKQ